MRANAGNFALLGSTAADFGAAKSPQRKNIVFVLPSPLPPPVFPCLLHTHTVCSIFPLISTLEHLAYNPQPRLAILSVALVALHFTATHRATEQVCTPFRTAHLCCQKAIISRLFWLSHVPSRQVLRIWGGGCQGERCNLEDHRWLWGGSALTRSNLPQWCCP